MCSSEALEAVTSKFPKDSCVCLETFGPALGVDEKHAFQSSAEQQVGAFDFGNSTGMEFRSACAHALAAC